MPLPCVYSYRGVNLSSPVPCVYSYRGVNLSLPLPCVYSYRGVNLSLPLPCVYSYRGVNLSLPLPCVYSYRGVNLSLPLPCVSAGCLGWPWFTTPLCGHHVCATCTTSSCRTGCAHHRRGSCWSSTPPSTPSLSSMKCAPPRAKLT